MIRGVIEVKLKVLEIVCLENITCFFVDFNAILETTNETSLIFTKNRAPFFMSSDTAT